MPAVTYVEFMEHAARGFEAVGAAVLVGGFALGIWRAAVTATRGGPSAPYDVLRASFGRTLLLGLEVLIAADLIQTVAVEPSVSNVLTLGLIVVIRTFLSLSVGIEVEGRVPWRRRRDATDGPAAR